MRIRRDPRVACVAAAAIFVAGCGRTRDVEVAAEAPFASSVVVMSFQDGVSPADDYTGTRASVLFAEDGSDPRAILLRWDVSSIPPGSVVQAAALTFRVTRASSEAHALYPVLRTWDESTATESAPMAGSRWNDRFASGAHDRGRIPVGRFYPYTAGERIVRLNAEGLAHVQAWIDGTASNDGFLVAAEGDGHVAAVVLRAASNPEERPRLTLTYIPAPGADAPRYASRTDVDFAP